MHSASAAPRQRVDNKPLLFAAIMIGLGVLSTTLPQTHVLARIPLQNLLKNELHADRSANAAFFFWMIFPWYFKPFMGIVSDAFPLFGSRRKSYLLIGGLLATLAWFGLSLTKHDYGAMLTVALSINLAMVIASTVVGGYMVETAQTYAGSGRLTSIRYFVDQFSWVVAGPAGGFLAGIAFGWTAVGCGCIVFLIVPATLLFLKERPRPPDGARLLHNAGRQLRDIFRARTMWAAAGLSGLFYFAPGVNTAVFYIQQNELHLGTQTQGLLTFVSGVGGIAAATIYGVFLSRRFTLRRLLVICLLFGTAANLVYLFYSSIERAVAIESFNGFGYVLAEVALMHLAVRATPAGSEALGFALMMSVRNLGLFGADWLGAYLLDHYHVPFSALVFANAATSFIAVPLVLLLPAIIVNVRDTRTPDAAIDLTPPPHAAPQ